MQKQQVTNQTVPNPNPPSNGGIFCCREHRYNYFVKRYHFLIIASIFISITLICVVPLLITIKPFFPYADYLLGSHKPTSYIVLLGNDTEMRANGGFVGSYAKVNMHFPQVDLDFQDIYVPDGQVKDHVPQPEPIQQAFGHGTWQLANADWEPDFPTASKALRWFFEKGKEINPDILAIINLSTIREIVDQVGPFRVPEYDSTITPENLYLFLQGKAEVGFFPGSTQKKDALYAVGHAFFKKIKSLPITKQIKIASLLYTELHRKNILVNSQNPDFQNFLLNQDYAGVLKSASEDTYSLVETNLGANKANQFVSRQTNHKIKVNAGSVHHEVILNFTNTSPEANPNPPFHYGGNYIAYLRFYIPASAKDIKIFTNDTQYFPTIATTSAISTLPSTPVPSIQSKYNLTEVGFYHITFAGGQSKINLSYNTPLSLPEYTLTILKQHGLKSSPQNIDINNKMYKTDLQTDFHFAQKIPTLVGKDK